MSALGLPPRLLALDDALKFADGRPVTTAADWSRRRDEIRKAWTDVLGEWPPLVEKPRFEILATETLDT